MQKQDNNSKVLNQEVQTNATGFSLLRNTRAKKAADRSSAIL
jgi:hypothetical protein